MREWAVPLYAALIAAVATVWTAFLTARKDRLDEQAKILQNIEILDKLPEGDVIVRGELLTHIFSRVQMLTCEEEIRKNNRTQFFILSFAIVVATIGVWMAANNYRDWELFIVAIGIIVAISIGLYVEFRNVINKKLRPASERQRELQESLKKNDSAGETT